MTPMAVPPETASSRFAPICRVLIRFCLGVANSKLLGGNIATLLDWSVARLHVISFTTVLDRKLDELEAQIAGAG